MLDYAPFLLLFAASMFMMRPFGEIALLWSSETSFEAWGTEDLKRNDGSFVDTLD